MSDSNEHNVTDLLIRLADGLQQAGNNLQGLSPPMAMQFITLGCNLRNDAGTLEALRVKAIFEGKGPGAKAIRAKHAFEHRAKLAQPLPLPLEYLPLDGVPFLDPAWKGSVLGLAWWPIRRLAAVNQLVLPENYRYLTSANGEKGITREVPQDDGAFTTILNFPLDQSAPADFKVTLNYMANYEDEEVFGSNMGTGNTFPRWMAHEVKRFHDTNHLGLEHAAPPWADADWLTALMVKARVETDFDALCEQHYRVRSIYKDRFGWTPIGPIIATAFPDETPVEFWISVKIQLDDFDTHQPNTLGNRIKLTHANVDSPLGDIYSRHPGQLDLPFDKIPYYLQHAIVDQLEPLYQAKLAQQVVEMNSMIVNGDY